MIDFGLDRGDFGAEYLERRHYLRRQALTGRPVGWRELDDVLYRIVPEPPSLQLFRAGPIDPASFTESAVEFGVPRRRLDKARFLRLLHGGATLVLNRMESHSGPVRRLCSEVGRFAGAMPASNAYLSLGGSGPFGAHWDTHDVFVLQLIGRKRWQIFAPTFSLPLGMHRSVDSGARCPDEPLADVVLETGDLLYLPRGYWHSVIPLDTPSLHLSVGTYAPTVHDYLTWLCSSRLPGLESARIGFSGDGQQPALMAAAEKLAELARDPSNIAAFEVEIRHREREPAEFNTGPFFATGVDGISDEAVVELNGYRPPHFVDHETIVCAGKRLRVDPLSRQIVETLSARVPGMSLGALRESFPNVDAGKLRLVVLDLELHGIVSIIEI